EHPRRGCHEYRRDDGCDADGTRAGHATSITARFRAVSRVMSLAPLACSFANFAAAVVLALVIAPATPLSPDLAERERYVRDHLVAWRASWAVWMIAAGTLLWCYAWWRAKVRASRTPLIVAGLGIVADWSAELLLIFGPYAEVASLGFFLTG